jgi:hypothetical protein
MDPRQRPAGQCLPLLLASKSPLCALCVSLSQWILVTRAQWLLGAACTAGYPIGTGADVFISVWNLHRGGPASTHIPQPHLQGRGEEGREGAARASCTLQRTLLWLRCRSSAAASLSMWARAACRGLPTLPAGLVSVQEPTPVEGPRRLSPRAVLGGLREPLLQRRLGRCVPRHGAAFLWGIPLPPPTCARAGRCVLTHGCARCARLATATCCYIGSVVC